MNQLSVMTWLADDAPRNTGPDFGKASPLGLLVVVLLLVATCFLVWSMNRHLKKLPESFDRDNPEPDQAADEGTVDNQADGTVTPADRDGSPHEPG
jgi:hypothetical protein